MTVNGQVLASGPQHFDVYDPSKIIVEDFSRDVYTNKQVQITRK